MSGSYNDIIDLPRPISERHPRMPVANRAAQFSPFAALSGYDDAVKETARLTDRKAELTEDEKSILDAKLQLLAEGACSEVTLIYFQPDSKKQGGAYLTVTSAVKKIDGYTGEVILVNGQRILIEDIIEIGL